MWKIVAVALSASKLLFSHTSCISVSANGETLKAEDTNLSCLFVSVSPVLIRIQSEWIKGWGKTVRLVVVLNSNKEVSNCSPGFGLRRFRASPPPPSVCFCWVETPFLGPSAPCRLCWLGRVCSPGSGCCWRWRGSRASLSPAHPAGVPLPAALVAARGCWAESGTGHRCSRPGCWASSFVQVAYFYCLLIEKALTKWGVINKSSSSISRKWHFQSASFLVEIKMPIIKFYTL